MSRSDTEGLLGLSTFVRVVEVGSFTGAARLQGATPSAISKSISRLERRLGVRLVQRSTRSFALTFEGQAYYERIAPLIHELEDAGDVLRPSAAPAGLLRVSMPNDLGRVLMEPITTDFLPGHPALKLEVNLTDRHVDLIREGFDIAIRIGQAADSRLISRPLGELPLVLVASPAYLTARGRPETVEALQEHEHVRYMLAGSPYPITFADGAKLNVDGPLDVDSGEALRIGAVNGLGIVQILLAYVADDLEAGRLSLVLPQSPLLKAPVQALHAFGRAVPSRARVFIDFVAAKLGAWRAGV